MAELEFGAACSCLIFSAVFFLSLLPVLVIGDQATFTEQLDHAFGELFPALAVFGLSEDYLVRVWFLVGHQVHTIPIEAMQSTAFYEIVNCNNADLVFVPHARGDAPFL